MALPTWNELTGLLDELHPQVAPPPTRDPFGLVLWEQVAYLAKDDVRSKAFRELERLTALDPARILAVPLAELEAVTSLGGRIGWKERAQRIRASAELAHTLTDLRSLPLAEARKRLLRFAMIGAPGADKVLLFAGLHPVFALESNGLRVLLRVGFAREGKDYAASYAAVMEALAPLLPKDASALAHAHLVFRAHGTAPCKRTKPVCEACLLQPHCRFARG